MRLGGGLGEGVAAAWLMLKLPPCGGTGSPLSWGEESDRRDMSTQMYRHDCYVMGENPNQLSYEKTTFEALPQLHSIVR